MKTVAGYVEMEDKKTGADVECKRSDSGSFDQLYGEREITKMALSSCKYVKAGACEGTPTMEALHLPWSAIVTDGSSGKVETVYGTKGTPGFKIGCQAILGKIYITCTGSKMEGELLNYLEAYTASAIAHSESWTCESVAGIGSGRLFSKDTIEFAYGGGARAVDAKELEELHAAKWEKNGKALTAAEPVKGKGKITLADGSLGAKVECETSSEGTVGPGYGGEVQHWKASNCKVLVAGLCTKGVSLEAYRLPWVSELIRFKLTELSEAYNRNVMVRGSSEAPGIVFHCKSEILEVTALDHGGIYTNAENTSTGVEERRSPGEKLESVFWSEGPLSATIEGNEELELTKGGKLEA
jgi:hypothetical protein